MKNVRNPRLGKRPRIKKAIPKESMEGQKTYEDYKRVTYHKNQKPMDQVKAAGKNKDCIQLK